MRLVTWILGYVTCATVSIGVRASVITLSSHTTMHVHRFGHDSVDLTHVSLVLDYDAPILGMAHAAIHMKNHATRCIFTTWPFLHASL